MNHISEGMFASFVRKDYEILQFSFEATDFYYEGYPSLPGLARRVAMADVVYSWFAWDHALWANRFAQVLGKRTVVTAGGFDVTSVPEIDYGSLLHAKAAARVRETLNRADRVLAVSQFNRQEALRASGRADVRLIPLGFEPGDFPFSADKDSLVVTVGVVSESTLKRKGIDSFLRVARLLPHIPFVLIGGGDPAVLVRVRQDAPRNVSLTGWVSEDQLRSWLRRAKVYAQLSAHEAFGSSVAESMLAGCVPVVSNRGALPEIVGPEGLVVEWGDIDAASKAVASALELPAETSARCRERIVQCFPLEKRRKALVETVEELL